MSRHTDIRTSAPTSQAAALPPINWSSIGETAPVAIPIGNRNADDPLPQADIVVVTWTDAEWSALDHVFVNSTTARTTDDRAWQSSWHAYTRNTGGFTSTKDDPLWGTFQLVQIAGKRVLLFRSNAHLTYSPWIAGLRAMIRQVLTDSHARCLYSIGTAGGGRLDQNLGDAVITNGGTLQATLPHNKGDSANGQTFTCATWYPSLALMADAAKLMFRLSTVATPAVLQALFTRAAAKAPPGATTLDDVLNSPMTNTSSPTAHSLQGVPLNTSDDYGMAPGTGSPTFSVYEEDDAVLGQVALELNVPFAFIRNVSDTVVPAVTKHAQAIDDKFRKAWAGDVYDQFGMYAANNGALATWAAITASP
jgi:nucleoside phosphorylase